MSFLRKACCICEQENLLEVLIIEQMPIYMGTVTSDGADDTLVDQTWVECDSCGVIQLKHLGDLRLVYLGNHHQVEVGSTWNRHHSMFADFIVDDAGASILELGAGAGYLASRVLSRSKASYRVVEPKPGIFPAGVEVIEGFIEDNYDIIGSADTIIHSHLIEHIYSPRDFLRRTSDQMQLGTKLFMSVPNFEGLLESPGSVNVLNFEHTYYLHRQHLEELLRFHGMRIDKISFFENHSLFVGATKVSETELPVTLKLEKIEGAGSQLVKLWSQVEDFAHKFAQLSMGNRGQHFIFGAHVFAQAFLNKIQPGCEFVGILDNDPTKQGSRLYGTPLKVFNPEVIALGAGEIIVALMASHYQDEIREQLVSLNPEVRIIEP